MKFFLVILLFALAAGGCASTSKARLKEQNAFLAGQNAMLRQQQQAQSSNITVLGPVQNSQVPWVAGLTLVQAVATANYLATQEPRQIVITRQGENAILDGKVLFNGAVVPLEPGDTITLR